MSIKALIFDFDGLILDTETPNHESWQEIFRQYGFQLPMSEWQKGLGTSPEAFTPAKYLEELVGYPLNKKKVEHDQRLIALSMIFQLPPLPGVEKLLSDARASGIKIAVASSSTTDWVWCNLVRLGLLKYFDTICTGDEVDSVKPDPALFQLAISELGVLPTEAIVFEDSPNGILAANNAGIFCIAVPNSITGQLNLKHANFILKSLSEISLEELLAIPEKIRQEK